MNKNLLTGLGIGVAITAIIAHYLFQQKLKAAEASYNEQLSLMSEGSVSAKKNQEFIEFGEDCECISTFKKSLNFMASSVVFETDRLYTPEFAKAIESHLANTNHFFNETGGIRKSFLYDINKTIANILDEEIPERELRNEYTSGMLTKGAKGKDVEDLQNLLNSLYDGTETKIGVTGDYNKETYNLVIETFHGTTALMDMDTGAISKEFVNNFSQILSNLSY